MPEVIDLSGSTSPEVYCDRFGFTVDTLLLHDTAGSTTNPDKNTLALSVSGFKSRENGTISWFQGSGGVSIHYLIGPEAAGAKIYRLCNERYAAYHAAGDQGSYNGVSKVNLRSIGIERWGFPNEPVGALQRASMLWLVADIARRHGIKPAQIISHKSIQSDRSDGEVLLAEARAAVAQGAAKTAPNIPAGMVPLYNPHNLNIYKDAFEDPVSGFPVIQPFASFYRDNGGLEKFGRPTSGLYGAVPGGEDQQFKYAHFYVDKASGKVIAEMKDRVNPEGKDVGPGMLATAKAHGFEMLTNEQYYVPDPAKPQPGLGKLSLAWAADPANGGQVHIFMAIEHPEQKQQDGTVPWEVKVVKEV